MKRPLVGLLALDVVYRLPGLLHAGDLSSDAAVVGLQAMHLLRGEFSWLLWGASYQGTLEPMVAALFFAVGGATPLMLSLSALAGHLVILGCAWRVLARRLDAAKAFGLCLVLVFTPQAVNHLAWLPQPRIWSIALAFVALVLIDVATPLTLAAGLFVGMLGVWADLFVLQLMVPLLLFAALCASSRRHAVALVVGLGAGIAAVVYLRTGTRVFVGPGGMSLANVPRNAALLWDSCLPMILGVQVWDPEPWAPPVGWRVWQWVGATALVLSLVAAAFLSLSRGVAPESRRLGLLGAAVCGGSVVGFLVSGMPGDLWAARYLVGLIFFAPFALTPLAARLTLRGLLVAVLVPYLSVAAVSGLRSWGWQRFSLPPARTPEDELAAWLRQRQVRYAAAHYWVAYRLTFLFREEPIVAPLEGSRYPPYGEAFAQAERVAYITHPSVPDLTREAVLQRLRAEPGETIEETQVAEYTVILRHR